MDELTSLAGVLAELERVANSANVEGMQRFGIAASRHAYGVKMPDLRRLGRRVGNDHALAQDLWATGSRETRILATLVDVAEEVTEGQMDAWAAEFDDWEICDQACMNLFWRTTCAADTPVRWASRDEEFVKRAAFALIAVLAWKDRAVADADILAFLPLVQKGAADPRPLVRKAVDWALRQIGKRSASTHGPALELALEMAEVADRNVAWVGRTAARELDSERVRERLGVKATGGSGE